MKPGPRLAEMSPTFRLGRLEALKLVLSAVATDRIGKRRDTKRIIATKGAAEWNHG